MHYTHVQYAHCLVLLRLILSKLCSFGCTADVERSIAESTSKVHVSSADDISWCEIEGAQEERNSDFNYVESAISSELGSPDEDKDAENLEAAIFNSSFPAKPDLRQAERQSLLPFDKDLEEEDLETGSRQQGVWNLKARDMIQAQMKKHHQLSVLVVEEQAGEAEELAEHGMEAEVHRDKDEAHGDMDVNGDVDRDKAGEEGEHGEEAELLNLLKNIIGVCIFTCFIARVCIGVCAVYGCFPGIYCCGYICMAASELLLVVLNACSSSTLKSRFTPLLVAKLLDSTTMLYRSTEVMNSYSICKGVVAHLVQSIGPLCDSELGGGFGVTALQVLWTSCDLWVIPLQNKHRKVTINWNECCHGHVAATLSTGLLGYY